MAERREIALNGLDHSEIEWDELLTPQEREWFGEPFAASDPEDLPLWPEALARGKRESGQVHFPSDLDEDLELPICVNFYSLRGGVGRSTALAYTGRILAAKGRKVVCMDMDLEAPGLASLFGCEQKVKDGQGVVDLLVRIDQRETPDIAEHLIKVTDDDLYCIPAGIASADYARMLNFIDPAAWYREEKNPLRSLIEMIESRLPFKPDVILLDSRTGITPLSGPLLFDIADISIITYFPHPQAKTGTQALVKALLRSKSRRVYANHGLTPEPRFLVSPIPSSQVREIIDRYRNRALEWVEEWLQSIAEPSSALDVNDITHFITYKETLATSDSLIEDKKVWDEYEPIVNWIERFLPMPSEKIIESSIGTMKTKILDELRFSAGTAERQDDFMATFVETDIVKKAMALENPLVIGCKGTGKTAIFRWMTESDSSAVIHAPTPLDQDKPWILSSDGFEAIGELIERRNTNWRQLWGFYICYALYLQKTHNVLPPNDLHKNISSKIKSETELIDAFDKLSETNQFGLRLNDWLSSIDASLSEQTVLLIDGLDVGFGSSESDRDRRNEAISGLFVHVICRL